MKRRTESSFVLFDVTYMDGSRSSHRKVPTSTMEEGEAAARTAIETQDQKVALASGRPQGTIKSLQRSRT
ncbi:MAG TPA: hypothetical protein VND19_19740 [Acetobacteraceae bacterium]|nr:hypothetical protein [Acetobacteraceae bacterium]